MGELKKKLTLYGLTMIAVGSCIGAGIFKTPSQIVEVLPHHGWVLVIWIIGGLITLTGALTFGELGAIFPKSGGVYVFLKEAYGDLAGFCYGWMILLVINTGSLAALGLAFAEYMTFFVDLTYNGKILLGAGLILGLTIINIFGVSVSQMLVSTFTTLKLIAIAGVIMVAIAFYGESEVTFQPALETNLPDNLTSALLLALIGVLWSFGGWHHASYLAGETKNAQTIVPKAMIFGAIIVTCTYVLVNLGYMLLLPLDQMAVSERVAADALGAVFLTGGKIVAVVIAISIFGTVSIYTMSAPRIYQAMAEDGIFFKKLAEIHPTYGTPANAMLFQAVWAVVLLVFWGTFHDLITYVTFADLSFMLLAGVSIFIFRKRSIHSTAYKVPLYPWIPLMFAIATLAFVLNTLVERPLQSGIGIGLLALGLPFYYYFKRSKS
ncbi:MAG: amino acid permease [Bacteroidia bacterium]|nr:amino acid permease [Bacteroidia bacterium]